MNFLNILNKKNFIVNLQRNVSDARYQLKN